MCMLQQLQQHTLTNLLSLILPARILSREDLPEPGGPSMRHMRPCNPPQLFWQVAMGTVTVVTVAWYRLYRLYRLYTLNLLPLANTM